MKRLARATIAAVTILGLGVPSIVGASSSITTSGSGARTTLTVTNENEVKVKNNNNLSLNAVASQGGTSGNVDTKKNTEAGDSASGDVENSNAVAGTVTIDNSSSSDAANSCGCAGSGETMGDILTSGPDAKTKVEVTNTNEVKVTNNNNIAVSNVVSQSGASGNVKVEKNTGAGNAVSGNVTNTSTTTLMISVIN
jgi:hypothetical protein